MPGHSTEIMQDRTVEAIVRSARDLLETRGDRTTAQFLSQWPMHGEPSRRVSPRELPVLEWVDDLEQVAVPETRALVSMFVESARRLAWAQTYSREDFGDAFLARYAWTELIGLRGPIASSKIAAGFLLLGPDVEYPLHSHEAEELYLPVAGTAKWRREYEDWTRRAPGTTIYHASCVPHAMKTQAEPLLAVYVWRGGNLTQKSTILER